MINKESNVKKLKNLGYSQQDAEDFADEFEQGGNKVSKKINEILSDEGVYERLLNNYRNNISTINDLAEFNAAASA